MSRPMAPYYGVVERVESGGDHSAVSPKGARGVMQLMPGTIRDPGFGVTPPRDNSEAENRRVGQEYLDAMHNRYGDPKLALMAYNWGPGNVDKWIKNGRNPNAVPQETRGYVSKIMGPNAMATPTAAPASAPALLIPQQEQRNPVAPVLAQNPNAPAQIQSRPILSDAMVQEAMAPQTNAAENSVAMQQLKALEGNIDANVRARQAALLGPEAAQFAQQNNLAFNDPRVLEMAAKKNVNPLQKGLSILQGIIGTPLGIIGNALGENIDYTAAFTPEKTYRTRAQAAIAALDAQGLEAKKEIAGMRQDTRQSIFTAIAPAVQSAYNLNTERGKANIGDNLEEQMVNDALRKNGFVDQFGNVDRSSPQAQQFILDLKQQLSVAGSAGKTNEVAAGLAAGMAAAAGVSSEFYKANQKNAGELGVKAYEDITTKGRVADTLVPKLDFLVAQSTRFGSNYTGITGDIRKFVQEAGAGLGIDPSKYKDLTDAQIFDSVANDVGITQAQRMPGTLAAQELGVALSIAGTYRDTAAGRDIKLRTMRAGAKGEQAYRDAAMEYYRNNDNVFDEAGFRASDSYRRLADRPLWYYDRKLLPTMIAGDRQRYADFARTRDGKLVVSSGGKTYDISKLSNDELLRFVRK